MSIKNFIAVNNLNEVFNMKKVIYLALLSITLLADNKVWLGIVDLGIDNGGNPVTKSEINKIEDVSVKFRIGDLIKYVEKKLN